jgi:hypothetical protein
MDATMIECCSCKALCPCWLGPDTVPDRGWCGGALVFDINKGSVDGVDVGGCRAALAAQWPGNFFAGNGTARIYLDSRSSDAQRKALEAVFSGKKGGMFGAVLGPAVASWLPAATEPIDIQRGESLSLTVGAAGRMTLTPYKDASGRTATVQGTAAQAAFQSASMELASAKGSRWSDTDFRAWEGDSGTTHKVQWSG